MKDTHTVPVSALYALIGRLSMRLHNPEETDVSRLAIREIRDEVEQIVAAHRPERAWALYAGGHIGFVRGFVARTRWEATVRLSDREANGEAFPGEHVVELPAVCDAQDHTSTWDALTCPVCHPPAREQGDYYR